MEYTQITRENVLNYKGIIKNKQFIPDDPAAFTDKFNRYKDGERCIIDVKKIKATRSILLNNYYWGVIIKYISDETGQDQNDVHEILKQMFLEPKIVKFGGVNHTIPASTASLDNEYFIIYANEIRDWASQFLNLYIPEPNEYLK
jgi:hypothetical protein